MNPEFTGERFLPDNSLDAEIAIEHMQRYNFAKKFVKDKCVLDAACGEGYGSKMLSECAKSVVGIDVDETAVSQAKEKYKANQLSFVVGTIAKLPFEDNSFDVVVSFETIEHVGEEVQLQFLEEIYRVLKHDGILIMSTPDKLVYTDLVHGSNQYHIREFYRDEFEHFLKKRFEQVDLYNQYPQLTYILTNKANVDMQLPSLSRGNIRYYIAVCSNRVMQDKIDYQDYQLNSDMYYYLYRENHDMEKTLRTETAKHNAYENKLNEELKKAKEYVQHLETDILQLKNVLIKKEEQIAEINTYVKHLEKDIQDEKQAVQAKEEQIQEIQAYARHLEHDIRELKNVVDK